MTKSANALFVSLSLASFSVTPALAQDGGDAPALSAYHARARIAVAEVLAEREFAERLAPTWLTRCWDWIKRTLAKLPDALGMMPAWVGIVLLIWLLLALLAILVHLACAIGGLVGNRGKDAFAARNVDVLELYGVPDLDADSVYAEARRRLGEQDWSGAVRLFYIAAILLLDRAGLVRLRQDKTNRDYLHELAAEPKYRASFEVLTHCFENSFYGGRPTDEAVCDEVTAQMDVFTDAHRSPS